MQVKFTEAWYSIPEAGNLVIDRLSQTISFRVFCRTERISCARWSEQLHHTGFMSEQTSSTSDSSLHETFLSVTPLAAFSCWGMDAKNGRYSIAASEAHTNFAISDFNPLAV